MLRKNLIAAVALGASASMSSAVQAQTKWDMPTPYSEGEFHTRNAKAFAEDVKKNTNGALDVTVHSNQSLIKHADVLRAVSTGQVNIGEFLLGQFANEDPVFAAANVPFVAPGYDGAMKFYKAQKRWPSRSWRGAAFARSKPARRPGKAFTPRDRPS